MRLLKNLVEYKLNEFMGKKSNSILDMWSFYQAYTLSSVSLNKDIKKHSLLNRVWRLYNKNNKYKSKLESVMNIRIYSTDLSRINEFLRFAEEHKNCEVLDTDFSGVGVVAIASYFYDE